MRILVIDDDADTRRFLQKLLLSTGHTVDTAATLSAGREMLLTQQYDAILSDLTLPDGNGLNLFNGIDPHPCAFAVTGHDCRDEIAAAGFKDCIRKPFTFAALEQLIASCGA